MKKIIKEISKLNIDEKERENLFVIILREKLIKIHVLKKFY